MLLIAFGLNLLYEPFIVAPFVLARLWGIGLAAVLISAGPTDTAGSGPRWCHLLSDFMGCSITSPPCWRPTMIGIDWSALLDELDELEKKRRVGQ